MPAKPLNTSNLEYIVEIVEYFNLNIFKNADYMSLIVSTTSKKTKTQKSAISISNFMDSKRFEFYLWPRRNLLTTTKQDDKKAFCGYFRRICCATKSHKSEFTLLKRHPHVNAQFSVVGVFRFARVCV